jgi:IS30 family transposase
MVQIRQSERRLKVLELSRDGKSEIEIAKQLHVGRNTIVRDIRWLKQNIIYDFNLVTNEVLQELHNRIDKMKNADLISFLGKLIPQRIEAKGEITQTQRVFHLHMWKPEQVEPTTE